jgi:hypothetical protein
VSTTTEAERQERREADRRRAAAAVEALKSSEGWRSWLRARSKFHNYSLTISGAGCRRRLTPLAVGDMSSN